MRFFITTLRYTTCMDRMKSIIGKALLFFIVSFVMHDYMVGQNLANGTDSSVSIKVENLKKSVHHFSSHSEIHQVFHSPALIADSSPTIYSVPANAPEQREVTLLQKRDPFIPYTPPKSA